MIPGIVPSKRLAQELAMQHGRFKETAACYAAREAAKEWIRIHGLNVPFWLRDGFKPGENPIRVPLRETRR